MKLAAALLVLAIGCNEHDRETAPAPAAAPRSDQTIGAGIVPMTHEFPPGRAGDIRRLFEKSVLSYPISVVSDKGAQTQFVNPNPVFVSDRQFVVGLPPEQHAALDRMIARLDKSAATPAPTYELTFWLVEASPAAKLEIAADLGEVGPMLEKLANLGTRRFRSLDRVGARSVDGTESRVGGQTITVEHELSSVGTGIELRLKLALRTEGGPMVQTRLHVPLDRPIVIGDSAAGAGAANLLLYVVRARRVD